ncbi:MAG: AAA family ATPase [Sodalinema sp.]|uniref:trifunctional serine/threonine-protein kinase/ATP-binding protein/sensor histidine kinase n=1 Tax=Sodalinema sp. TaxID=3080550 RepID=UPI00396F66CF
MLKLLQYQVLETLSENPTTIVYRAIEDPQQRPVILKTLLADHPKAADIARLRYEHDLVCQLDCPGIVKPYGLQQWQGRPVLVLEDFGGRDLTHWLNPNSLDLEQTLRIGQKIAIALGQLHQQHLIHKDLKPENIVFNPQTQALKLIDFSISSRLGKENPCVSSPNVLQGTLAYMSPEQTGRMNRAIDYRSDFYALGVTLYELLTGHLPFDSNDPMELIHCHIAKPPRPPHERRTDLPESVSAIVLKLMAKTAEDRYQSSYGIQKDLETCLTQWTTTQHIPMFELASQDQQGTFSIPEKLYGRDAEVQQLLDAFDRISQGPSEMLLVAGYSGIGKSALVKEVHKPIVRQRGYFISGKFDQFQRNIPYACLIQAFRELVRQLLTETEAEILSWRDKITQALGKNGQIITDVIPEIELIIGTQPAVSSLPVTEAQNRFNLVFRAFIQVFTQPEHPLVMFLDDLQWADPASLQLIHLLIADPDSHNLLMLGAYRDNEVSLSHPLMTTLAKIQQDGITVETLTLKPLTLDHVNGLVGDTLNQPQSTVEPLSKLLLSKTQGNPFFITQTFKHLYSENLLQYHQDTASWFWNLEQLLSIDITENVVELMAYEIQRLDASTQHLLQLAACIGNNFNLDILAIVNDASVAQTAAELWSAIHAGLVIPLARSAAELWSAIHAGLVIPLNNQVNHQVNHQDSMPEAIEESGNAIVYKFLHDRVQQAAYSLIPDACKQEVHLQVGRRLLEYRGSEGVEERLFDIVNALNLGASLIDDPAERRQLSQLNLDAAMKAKAAAAYASALEYLNVGRQLLPDHVWTTDYKLALELYTQSVDVYYIQAQFSEAQVLSEIVFKEAKTLLDKVKIYELKIQFFIAQNQMLEALDTALLVLELLGHPLEVNSDKLELVRTTPTLEELANYPEMRDPYQLAVLRILAIVSGPAYQARPELLPHIVVNGRNLCLQFGHSALAAYSYGMIGSPDHNIEASYYAGLISLKILEQYPSDAFKCKVHMLFNSFNKHWKEPHYLTISALDETVAMGMDIGDVVYAAYCAMWSAGYMVVIGMPLPEVAQKQTLYLELLGKIKQDHGLYPARIWRQLVQNLQGDAPNGLRLAGEYFGPSDRATLEIAQNRMLLFFLYFAEAFLAYIFKDWPTVKEKYPLAGDYQNSALSSLLFCYYHVYDTLINCAIYPELSPEDQAIAWDSIQANTAQIEIWRQAAPENYQSKWDLIQAEQARLQGHIPAAMDYYDRAIASAQQEGFLAEVAIAAERAADFYYSLGREKIANHYLQDAYYAYERWGATAKMKALLQEHPTLHRTVLQQDYSSSSLSPKITLSHSNPNAKVTVNQSTLTHSAHSNDMLDLGTVLKATQVLSGQIRLPQLLEQLMSLALENAGAQQGYLLLIEEGTLQIAASGQIESNIRVQVETEPLAISKTQLPLSLVHYVQRTQESVVLSHAVDEELFSQDPYIQSRQIQSILCLPIVQQGTVLGLLYLENNLTQGAFTRDRLEILKILSAQAAISIENARLYRRLTEYNHHLEDKVAERTQELQQKNQDLESTLIELRRTQTQLIQTEKMSSLGQMVAGLAHEINNPISFIGGNIVYARDYFNDLQEVIELYQNEVVSLKPSLAKRLEDIDLDFLYQDIHDIFNSMQKGSDRIRSIILGLRNFSRLDESQSKMADIHEGLDSTLSLVQHRLNPPGQQPGIKIHKTYGELPRVNCYPSQLNQVFLNLLNNAIDALLPFTEQTQPKITITTAMIDANRIQIQFSDNGPGMSEDVSQKIFDPFFTTKPVGQGTGLGLSISYQIITDQHNGQLSCDTQPGQGSQFTIEIPIQSI